MGFNVIVELFLWGIKTTAKIRADDYAIKAQTAGDI